jgi:alpha-D-ribose 1-methylphosphonate 5-triphosphate synthase subunit PhnG
MKTFVKFALVNLCLSFAALSAAEYFSAPDTRFNLNSEEVSEKFESAVLNPEGILKRFNPTGAVIERKLVRGSYIEFMATKKVMGISKKVFVRGELTTERSSVGCLKNELAYAAKMDFSKSDAVLSDNIDSLQMNICITEKSDKILSVRVQSKLLKGYKYGRVMGTIAKEIIEAQIDPIVSAIKAEVASK